MKIKKRYYTVPIIMLLVMMVAFIGNQPVNSLTMDVNPSIEIVTSRLDRVVEINPLNEDAEKLLKNFNPKDKNIENTVNDLVDLMILTGHIEGGEDNFVMITVDDDSMDSKFVNKVNKAIAAMLENKKIEAMVLNQGIIGDEKEDKITGVELAAKRLHELDDDLDIEEIEDMTVKELINYSQSKNIPIENIFKVAVGNGDKLKESKTIISKEKARELALEKINGEILKIELDDFNDDDAEYEIEIKLNDKKYEIEMDAYTGKVTEFEVDEDDDNDDDNKANEKPVKSRITLEEAKKIAMKKTGGGTITEFESDDDEYEIEIKYNGKEYEIEIDAYTGKVTEFEVDEDDDDNDDNDDNKANEKPVKSRITLEEAKKIAMKKTGGGTITEFEVDDDEFEIEIKFNGKEYEIEIDAYTGKITEFEADDIDD